MAVGSATAPLISTRQGKVRGAVVGGIHVFSGVPFAAAPFGPERFREPRPVRPWSGVRTAITDGVVAPQGLPAGIPSDGPTLPTAAASGEDCLNLTIWTPEPGSTRLPVLIWITGGMFEVGSATWYDGSRFARDGVVCVAINYRVGAEGFLYLADAAADRGLLDQIAAVKWVKDNIAGFGGDPDNITVCGESAGAMSVGTLLGMPAASGLFRRAIMQSGAAHQVQSLESARRIGEYLAERLEVAPRREAMAAVSWPRLLAAQIALKEDLTAHPDPERWGLDVVASMLPWQPVVDGEVIPDLPLERIRAGSAAAVDVLVGSNIDEWRLFALFNDTSRIDERVLTGPISEYGFKTARAYGLPLDRGLRAYRDAYPAARPGELLAAIQTDWWCRIPAIRLADAHLSGTARTFMYEFAWRSPVMDGAVGACHALEIPFVFDTLDLGPDQLLGNLLLDAPQSLATAIHQAWVSFATHGDPGWPKYDLRRRATMRFDSVSEIVTDPRSWERSLWEGVR